MSYINEGERAALNLPVPGAGTGTGTGTGSSSGGVSWFEALAEAWGSALNAEALTISGLSRQLTVSGADTPSVETQLTAESQRMDFLSNSEASSINAVGDALQAVARKQ